jgi:antitoxin FitA
MANLTIKGIPDELLDHLRKQAARHRRSLNSEIIHVLERSVASHPITAAERLHRIHRLQEKVPLPPLTEELLEKAIGEARS